MPTFHVTTDRPKVPAATFVADDLVDLGQQIAGHLTRHRVLSRAVPFEAHVGDDRGAINQNGLHRPIQFTFRKA